MFSDKMKLLTLNTHSLLEENQEKKIKTLVKAIIAEKFDVIALQEVNQPKSEVLCENSGIISLGYPVKNGNFMMELMGLISGMGYKGVWCGFKESYGRFDEGVGIITRFDITKAESIPISSGMEILSWKKRCAVKISTPKGDFISTHISWWNDADEPFSAQWEKLRSFACGKRTWIMGDFNAESDIKNEGYDLVMSSNFYDTYTLAKECDSGYTVAEKIDGWETSKKKRIDYIFSSFPEKIKYSRTIFNGTNYERVSDHFGVMIETEA